jgi:8-oxo-dGTP pyrophosphatase MutT (NUDIX family)
MNDDAVKQYSKEHPKRDVAVLGLRDFEGNVLLMRTRKLSNYWQPIGGGIEPEDSSPKAAAVRELNEEFEVRLDINELTNVLTTPYDLGEGTIYFFEAKVDRNTIDFTNDPEQVVEHRWFSKEEAIELPAMAATQKYLQQLSI